MEHIDKMKYVCNFYYEKLNLLKIKKNNNIS